LRHYVICNYCRNKIYFSTNARVRSELPVQFNLVCPHCNNPSNYHNSNVFTEVGQLRTGGAILGGLLGLAAGGGAAALLGAILGGLLGESQERADIAAVKEFNSSV